MKFSGRGILFLAAVLIISLAAGCGGDDQQGTQANTADQSAVAPRKTDVIVFIRGGEVWAVNPNNKAEFRVTGDGMKKKAPRLSPDGKAIVYFVTSEGSESSSGIYRVPLAQDATPEMIRADGSWPAWSTDGKSIAFVKQSPGAAGQTTDDIAIISADDPGAEARTLTDHRGAADMGGALAVTWLDYSPDGGKYIYFMRGRRSDSRWLARLEVATGTEDNLESPPGPMPASLADGGFSLFNVSQMEGRRALVSKGDITQGNYQQDFQLFIRFLEPQLQDSMIEDSAGSINPSLKPDNTRFVYENNGVLYLHKLAGGGDIERVADGSWPDWGASSVGPGFGVDDDGDTTTTATTTTTTNTGGDDGGTGTRGGESACSGDGLPGTEYVVNGDFESGLASWSKVDIKKKGSNEVGLTTDSQCGQVLALVRRNSANDGGMAAVQQALDVDSARMSSLKLRLVCTIDKQDLTSDGWYDGETPVFVTVDYTTAGGTAKTWTHGLMLPGSGVNYPDRDGVITAGGWYIWDSANLRMLLPDAARINKITVGGSGWDFRSRVALVSLRGME